MALPVFPHPLDIQRNKPLLGVTIKLGVFVFMEGTEADPIVSFLFELDPSTLD